MLQYWNPVTSDCSRVTLTDPAPLFNYRQLIRYSDPDQPLWPTAIDRIAAQPKAPTWLARFRQNKASDSGQAGDEQTDVLTALRKSFVVVRGGIASEQEGAASVSGKQGERVGGAVQPDGNEEAKSEAGNSATEASQMPQTAAAQAEGDGSGEPSTTVVATEALKGVEKEGVGAQRAEAEGAPGSKEKDTALGAHLALQIKMTLPSSCYATMAIRELLKTSTAVRCVYFLFWFQYCCAKAFQTCWPFVLCGWLVWLPG